MGGPEFADDDCHFDESAGPWPPIMACMSADASALADRTRFSSCPDLSWSGRLAGHYLQLDLLLRMSAVSSIVYLLVDRHTCFYLISAVFRFMYCIHIDSLVAGTHNVIVC